MWQTGTSSSADRPVQPLSVKTRQPVTSLAEGDRVAVAPSPHTAQFVRFGERRFHQILKAKFGLADR